jgi:hypothetical protein
LLRNLHPRLELVDLGAEVFGAGVRFGLDLPGDLELLLGTGQVGLLNRDPGIDLGERLDDVGVFGLEFIDLGRRVGSVLLDGLASCPRVVDAVLSCDRHDGAGEQEDDGDSKSSTHDESTTS